MPNYQRQQGVTSVEYAILAALIVLAILGGLSATGAANGGLWGYWTAAFFQAIGVGGN